MENKLKALFDFQKFEGNSDLQQVIDSVHARYRTNDFRELSLDEMEMLSAAGEPEIQPKKKDKKNGYD